MLEGMVMTLVNVYAIENQSDIRIKYRLYRVRGIHPQSQDFDKNAQLLSDKLSRETKSPCAIIKEDSELFIAQPVGYPDLPNRMPLVGTIALLELTGPERELDYGSLTEKDRHIAIRFLQFHVDGLLHHNPSLWRPSAGLPYFQKQADPNFRGIGAIMYRGFRFRLIGMPENKLGVCVDVTRKYASPVYLPAKITDNDLRKYKGRRCVYEYGNRWYEISISGMVDLTVSDVIMPDKLSLFDHVHAKAKGQKPPGLMMLPKDCSVLTYQTSFGEVRHVPSALCRLTFATNQPEASKYHSSTIMSPHIRKQEIEFVVRKYLKSWHLQGTPIVLSEHMSDVECDLLATPSLLFGGGRLLSQTDGGVNSVLEFGLSRKHMLLSADAGFFVKKQLDRQYLALPKSVYETYGPRFLDDVKRQFSRLYSPNGEIQYDPIVITYDDSVRKSIYTLGKEILRAADQVIGSSLLRSGYGLVIIPRLSQRRADKEDELANLLMREFRKMDIFVSVSHTEVPSLSYVAVSNNGGPEWRVSDDERIYKKYRGYLENLVLNKILLLNNLWPFVLSSPLNSDLVVGLDVKNNTAGFMFVFKEGHSFVFKNATSEQREQLSRGQVLTVIYDYLRKELADGRRKVGDITIHRDGRLYPEEIRGIKDALNKLAMDGLIEQDFNCNLLEIKKTSRVPVRLFEATNPQGTMKEWIENPRIGRCRVFDDTAFLCTTGRPFKYPGTTKPLQVVKLEGEMDFKLLLQDIFSLANLTWTKPEYCARLPISVKMTDIRLREVVGRV